MFCCVKRTRMKEKYVKKELDAKLKKVEQHEHVEEEGISIVQEMIKDINKHFNNNANYCANQQLIGHRDLFRGVIVK